MRIRKSMTPRTSLFRSFTVSIRNQKRLFLYLVFCIGALTGAISLIYGEDLEIIFGNALVFTSGNVGNYVIAIPLMAAVIIHRKRHVLRAVIFRDDGNYWFSVPLGIALILTSTIVYFYGSSTLYAIYYHTYSMAIFLIGATMLVFNFSTFRHVFFAIGLIAFLQPPPGELIGGFAADISWLSAVILDNAMHLFSIPAQLTANLGAPSFVVTKGHGEQNTFVIGEPSSGVFSTIGMSVFALFVAYISGGKLRKRVTLFAISIPLFFVLNTARISLIMLIWYFFNSDAAESFHLVGGVLMVTMGTILLLIIGEKALLIPYLRPKISIPKCGGCEPSSRSHEDFCLMCGRRLLIHGLKIGKSRIGATFLILIVGSLAFYANSVSATVNSSKGIESLNLRTIEGPETVQYVLPPVSNYQPVFAYRDKGTESVLNQDLALAYRYVPANNVSDISDQAAYIGIQISNSKHTWEDSLISYPSSVGRPSAKVIALEDTPISADKAGRFFAYQRYQSNATEAVIYWFERLPFNFGSHYENRNVFIVIWLYTDNLVHHHVIKNASDMDGTKNYLLSFAGPIAAEWKAISSQAIAYSFLNDFMNRNATPLVVTTLIAAVAIIGYRFVKNLIIDVKYKQLYTNLIIQPEQAIILATDTCSHVNRTGRVIAAKYSSILQTSVEPQSFVALMKKAKDAGFLRGEIATRSDIPYLVWKSRILISTKSRRSQVLWLFMRLLSRTGVITKSSSNQNERQMDV